MIKTLLSRFSLAASMLLARFTEPRGAIAAANSYDASAMTHECSVRRTNDSPVSTRHLLWKKGAGDNTIDISGAADWPLGTVDNIETGTGQGQSLLLLGKGATKKMIAGGVVNVGAVLVTAAAGQVIAIPTAPGVYRQIGVALTGANTAGDVLEALDCPPVAVTVS